MPPLRPVFLQTANRDAGGVSRHSAAAKAANWTSTEAGRDMTVSLSQPKLRIVQYACRDIVALTGVTITTVQRRITVDIGSYS
jgi:hypothetical protein